jgi:CBS domain containing-hemolysin-like protein
MIPGTEILLLFLAIFFFLFCSAYFSGSEAALFSLSTLRLRAYHYDVDPRKRLIAHLLSKPRDLLVTVFMLNTFVNILLQNTTSHLAGSAGGWITKVGIPLLLTLIFGELLPKYVGLQHNLVISYWVSPVISFFQKLLTPLRNATMAVTLPLSKILFFFLKPESPITTEEIQHILKQSEEQGVFTPEEGEMINGYLYLQEATVKELMRPREEILYHDIHNPLTKLIHIFVDERCTRVPVCNDNLDNILGVITTKQFFLHRQEIDSSQDLTPYLFKAFYTPETTSAWDLLRRLTAQKEEMALVVDEYGSLSGLITREDLIETVVGEIADLRDGASLYTSAGKNEIIASGKLELDIFNRLFDTHLESPTHRLTIGGWLTERLSEIPKSGTKYELEGCLFQILAATPSRIRRLYIRKLKDLRPQKLPPLNPDKKSEKI